MKKEEAAAAAAAGGRGDGRHQETVYRDATGAKIDMHEEMRKRDAARAKQLELDEAEGESASSWSLDGVVDLSDDTNPTGPIIEIVTFDG